MLPPQYTEVLDTDDEATAAAKAQMRALKTLIDQKNRQVCSSTYATRGPKTNHDGVPMASISRSPFFLSFPPSGSLFLASHVITYTTDRK